MARPRLVPTAIAALAAAGALAACGSEAARPTSSPPPSVALPRVGTIGDLPTGASASAAGSEADESTATPRKVLFVTVDPEGEVYLQVWKPGDPDRGDARRVASADLGKAVAAQSWDDLHDRTPDESASTCHAVLRIDESVPWRAAAWVLGALAEGRVYRVAFAVRPEGAGEEGVLAVYLPRDRGTTSGDAATTRAAAVTLSLVKDPTPTYCAHVQAALEDEVARARNTGNHPLVAEIAVSPVVPMADVLHVVDAALRAGVQGVAFLGDARIGKTGDPVADAVRQARPFAGRRLRVEVQGRPVPVPAPGTEVPCPRVERVVGRLAGSYDAALLARHVAQAATDGGR